MSVYDNGFERVFFDAKMEKIIEFGARGLFIFSLRYLMSREH